MGNDQFDMVILGGLGHVGLPLGIVFAQKGKRVCLLDNNLSSAETIQQGKMPFTEFDAEPILQEVLEKNLLTISDDPKLLKQTKTVIIAVGTPVDEYLNPKTRQFLEVIQGLREHLSREQTLIVRSTVYPQTCTQLSESLGGGWNIAYCPERIAQGYAVRELENLPQIVSGLTQDAEDHAAKVFEAIAPKIIRTKMEEAELIKLFSNAWRYIQFATTNQFYMMAKKFGCDYDSIRSAMKEGYGRAASLPGSGFSAGPCLLKDTMQLAAFDNNNFLLGHAAMMVNEGLPNFLVERLLIQHQSLRNKKVGILGMAFKGNIDDTRDSLSYKLGKILRFHGADVFYSDEHAEDHTFISKEEMVKKAEILIVGCNHDEYKTLEIPKSVQVVDIWNCLPKKD